jgi:SAM-dependent methyltransferase
MSSKRGSQLQRPRLLARPAPGLRPVRGGRDGSARGPDPGERLGLAARLDATREETRGPIRRLADDRLVPSSARPGSMLAQGLLLDALAGVAHHVGGRLLDVGCGEKPYEWLYGSRVTDYIGCDWLATVHSSRHLDLFADAAALPFRNEVFDTVLCTEVLEHLPDPHRCLEELSRVLRPGGKLILSTPFICWLHEQPHDYLRYTPYGLRYLARQHRLRPVSLQARGDLLAIGIDLWAKWFLHVLKRCGAARPFLGWIPTVGAAVAIRPQRAYLWLRAGARRHRLLRGDLARALVMADVAALGYVLVARRVPNNLVDQATGDLAARPH